MTLPVKTSVGTINGHAFLAGLSASAAWLSWTSFEDPFVRFALAGMCGVVAAPSAAKSAFLAVKDYRLRRDLAKTAETSTDHGTAREANWNEIVARGMHHPASGNFLGLHEEKWPVFAPPRTPFLLEEMPPGTGKTVYHVLSSILHQARLGKSLFIPDVKTELAPMLVQALRGLGIEVWCINPAKAHLAICGDDEINLYQAALDACHSDGAFRKDAVKLVLAFADIHLPEPKGGDDKNVFFRKGSRRCITIAILAQALLEPAFCTPSDVFAVLNDPARFQKLLVKLRYEITQIFPDDPVAEFLKTEAANLLDKFQNNAENAASFMEMATQALIAFNQGGRMAGYGRTATRNIVDMRTRQIVVFVMSPLSHTTDFAPVVSLLNHSLVEVCKREPAGHPIHIVGEEALNYRFSDLPADMETMRGLKVSADLYVQSFSGLVRKFGKDAAASIESYCDVKIYAGLTSLDRARHVSDMLAEATIRKQDYSFKAAATDINVSSREQARRLMTPDEVLAMPRNQAWVFVRGMRPLRLTMVDYGRISPWRDEVADNPLEGTRLRGEPLFGVRYAASNGSATKLVLEGVRPPRHRANSSSSRVPRVWPMRPRHMLWLPALATVWIAGFGQVATPHMRLRAEFTGSREMPYYRRCEYVGWYSRIVIPDDGRCPLVAFLSSN